MDASDAMAVRDSRAMAVENRRESPPEDGNQEARIDGPESARVLSEKSSKRRGDLERIATSSSDVDVEQLRAAIRRTSDWLWERQHSDGHWCAELEGDTILESEYILLLAWLGKADSERARQAALHIARKQEAGGGWSQFPGGPLDLSVSVKAYMALKLTGTSPSSPHMRRACEAIRAAGGADRVNSFTRFYLALLGQVPFDLCPAVPPELVLLPDKFPINIYRLSSWSRTIFVPLSIVWALRPIRRLSEEQSIFELYLSPPAQWPPLRSPGSKPARHPFTWETFFRGTDWLLKGCERWGLRPFRARALQTARDWMLERFEASDGLGAIFPPIIWSIIALRALGYDEQDPAVLECHRQLEALVLQDDVADDAKRAFVAEPRTNNDRRDVNEREGEHSSGSNLAIRLQPCKSPVWDTTLALRALLAAQKAEASISSECLERIRLGISWLLAREVRQRGDWRRRVEADPGGWYFEYRNEFYPDVDDSIMAILSLGAARELLLADHAARESGPSAESSNGSSPFSSLRGCILPSWLGMDFQSQIAVIDGARERAARWVLAMQNRDGGWGAFDRDNDAEFLCHVPFADHNAMIDPSTPDITARVLESLATWGLDRNQPSVARALRYLRETQEADGSWYGRWGVNHIYGTWQVLAGLASMGVSGQGNSDDDKALHRGVQWLLACQQPSGGWGESPLSYDDASWRGRGNATASQTAWALLGLLAADCSDRPAMARGIRYLLETQRADGGWDEPEFTGTGFPRVFYLRYHMYPIYFPLLALSQADEVFTH